MSGTASVESQGSVPPYCNTGVRSGDEVGLYLRGAILADVAMDYVTLTWGGQADEQALTNLLQRTAHKIMVKSDEGRVAPEGWAWNGYRGQKSEHVSWGTGPQGGILRCSGWAADEAREMGIKARNVSRADVAVTVWYADERPMVARLVTDYARQFNEKLGARRRKVRLNDGGVDGDTVYIGARTSDSYIRVYDKYRQQKQRQEYANAWRWEIEFKGKYAKTVWEDTLQSSSPRETMASTLRDVSARAGVLVPDVDLAAVAPALRPRSEPSTEASRLAWMRTQVRPTVQKLLTAGVDRFTIMKELGLM